MSNCKNYKLVIFTTLVVLALTKRTQVPVIVCLYSSINLAQTPMIRNESLSIFCVALSNENSSTN